MFEVTSKASVGMAEAVRVRIRELSSQWVDLGVQLKQVLQVVDAFRVERFGGLLVWPAGAERWDYLADSDEAWAVFQLLNSDRQRVCDDLREALDALKRFQK